MDKSSVEPTIFFIEKISFSLKLFSAHFYGQSFIKTVRGPFQNISLIYKYNQKNFIFSAHKNVFYFINKKCFMICKIYLLICSIYGRDYPTKFFAYMLDFLSQ